MKLKHWVLDHNHLLWPQKEALQGQFILEMTDTCPAQWPEGFLGIPLAEQWPGQYKMLVEENISSFAPPKHLKVAH